MSFPAHKASPERQDSASPLDALARRLDVQMRAVNALILDRMRSEVPLIPELAGYLIAAGGKRIRPLLTLAAARLCDCESNAPYGLAAAVEFIHSATLLHDDVVDSSAERRGRPSANRVFGNTASVLVGDFLFSRAFQLMVESGSLEALRILSNASAVIAEGEVMQLASLNDVGTGWERYLAIIDAKTAALFAAACEIGPVAAGSDEVVQAALRDYGANLGIAFQIADDVLDYMSVSGDMGKNPGDDFSEGKMTAPAILAFEQGDESELFFWKKAMGEKKQESGDFDRAREIVVRRGADKEALDRARIHARLAAQCLEKAPDSPLREILSELAFFAVERGV